MWIKIWIRQICWIHRIHRVCRIHWIHRICWVRGIRQICWVRWICWVRQVRRIHWICVGIRRICVLKIAMNFPWKSTSFFFFQVFQGIFKDVYVLNNVTWFWIKFSNIWNIAVGRTIDFGGEIVILIDISTFETTSIVYEVKTTVFFFINIISI